MTSGKVTTRGVSAVWAFVVVVALCHISVADAANHTANASPTAEPSADEIASLVEQLGDADYAVRETASARLAEIGPAAADALLAAAELSDDLEVALRAKWLADALPLTAADDPPEVTALLEPFTKSSLSERVIIMHRLLRLDDDAGIAALARIVRLERTPTGSRIAAALLAREWQPHEPTWAGIATRIIAGLGPSRRPAAAFLRGLVAATTATASQEATLGLDAAAAAVRLLDDPSDMAINAVPSVNDDTAGSAGAGRVFRRCVAELMARAGRRTEALAEASRLFESAGGEAAVDDTQIVADLEWLTSHGFPEAVDLLEDRLVEGKASPLLEYAAAVAWRARDGAEAAARARALSAAAAARLAEAGDFTKRLQVAMLLARFGADEWAEQEYRAVLDDRESPRALLALAAVLASEFFHDRQRDTEAAAILRRELEDRGTKGDDVDGAFMLIERDPRSVRSRMHYFGACAAAAAGDTAGERQKLEASIREYSKDVDTLIALYRLADNTPAQKADIAEQVAKGLAAIEEEIRALPDDPNSRNEYAWLVANTEGDITRALEYSRRALEHTFDSGSYLDTLAHCHAAAGDFARAVRTQRLAVRQEPHSRIIRQNLARFEARAAEAGQADP